MSKTIQTQFNEFHENIRLKDIEDNQDLRDKRDMFISELRNYFNDNPKDDKHITFSYFNQGSYAMGTGVKSFSSDDDYDIDVGISFDFDKDDFEPVEVKEWVKEALDKVVNRTVEIKRPCVRVQYRKEGEPAFHVDFALYGQDASFLAKGMPASADENKLWERSNPRGLKDLINNHLENESRSQFKRVIRYLKWWKNKKFSSNGNAAPTGIALTILAYNKFVPQVAKNAFTGERTIKDLEALQDLATKICQSFDSQDRIRATLPVEPYNDLFEKMTDTQCKGLKEKFEQLKDNLEKACDENQKGDPHEASKILRGVFGEKFPLLEKEETAEKKYRPAHITATEQG